MPAPKVKVEEELAKPTAARTAAAAAHFQHRRNKTLETIDLGSHAEMQDNSKHITEADQAPGNILHSISKKDVDTHLGDKEVSTDAFSNNEANNRSFARIKIGSNKNKYFRRHGEGEDGV